MLSVLDMVNGEKSPDFNPALAIHGVSTDSRKIEKGQLYIPLVGETFDGHQFVSDVIAKGAVGVLWQADHGPAPVGICAIVVKNTLIALQQLAARYREQVDLKVIGITGSNGKTTTKDMVAAIASTTFNVHKTAGNLNNHIGLPLTILGMDEQCDVLILEMGMSGFGEIHDLTQIAKPDAAIITIIGESHMLQLGSRKGIAQAKLEMIDGLKQNGLLIIPGNEPLLEEVMQERNISDQFDIVRFGESDEDDIYLTGVMVQAEQTSFTVNVSDLAFTVPMPGEHNAFNALSAITIGRWLNIPFDTIKRGLAQMVPTGMRMEVVRATNGLTIMNDAYNASPTSMKAALAWLKMLKGYRKKIVVLGDMLELGPNAEPYHREIGQELSPEVADIVFTYGPQAAWIAEEAKTKFADGAVQSFEEHATIAEAIRAISTETDMVLVKASRGMKLEQVISLLT
jgi:UDP-N-acetylmuramoyl-tripeptide--D-alanyl-D-alanine ligase